ncbi:hypothetical protein [Staphylococcus phage SpP]
MRYMVRKITDDNGNVFYDTIKVRDNEEYFEVEAHNRMGAVRKVKEKKDYLKDLDIEDFDKEISQLVDKNITDIETHNLDARLLVVLYQKLNHYLYIADSQIDMEYHKFTNYYLEEVTEKEIILDILEDIRILYKGKFELEEYETLQETRIRTMKMFYNLSVIFHNLWW